MNSYSFLWVFRGAVKVYSDLMWAVGEQIYKVVAEYGWAFVFNVHVFCNNIRFYCQLPCVLVLSRVKVCGNIWLWPVDVFIRQIEEEVFNDFPILIFKGESQY